MARLGTARSPEVSLPEQSSADRRPPRSFRPTWLRLLVPLLLLLAVGAAMLPSIQLSTAGAALDLALGPRGSPEQLMRAVAALERARLTNPGAPQLYRQLARGYLALGQPQEARRAIEQAYRLEPASLLIRAELADVQAALTSEAAALPVWERRLADTGLIEAAELARQSGRFAEALDWYRRAEAMGHQLASASAYVQYEAAWHQGEQEAAIAQLRAAVGLDTGWASAQQRLAAWRTYGAWLVEQRSYAQATAILSRVTGLGSAETPAGDAAEIHRLLGLALWGEGRLEPALAELAQARTLDPQSVWVQIHYGKVLFVADPSRLDEARDAFASSLALSGHDPAFYRNLIEFWLWQGQPAQAAQLCAEAAGRGITTQLADVCT